MSDADMKARIKRFLLDEFLQGEDEAALTDDVTLVSGGIIDSMASLRLVSFLEEQFGVAIPASQIDADHLDTLDLIVATVKANMPS